MANYRGTTAYHLVYAELIRAARYRGYTTYKEVARIGGLPTVGHAMSFAVGQMLGQIVDQELEEGRPLLSAIVVGSQGKVSEGFFAYARENGLLRAKDVKSADTFLEKQREAVYRAWQKP